MDPLKTVHSNWDADLERYVGAPQIKLDSPPLYWGRGRKYFSVIWWTDPEVWTLSSLRLHPAAFSQFILPTPPKLTPPGRVLSLCGAELPGWFFHIFFYRSGNGLAVFRRTELWMFPHNCAKHSHMQLVYIPSLFSPCENGMKLTCSEVICMSWVHDDVLVRSGLSRVLLFHGACFHAGLIDPRWAVSELSATPAEPTEIGFLLALKHCYVKGTTAQPKLNSQLQMVM